MEICVEMWGICGEFSRNTWQTIHCYSPRSEYRNIRIFQNGTTANVHLHLHTSPPLYSFFLINFTRAENVSANDLVEKQSPYGRCWCAADIKKIINFLWVHFGMCYQFSFAVAAANRSCPCHTSHTDRKVRRRQMALNRRRATCEFIRRTENEHFPRTTDQSGQLSFMYFLLMWSRHVTS